MAKQKRLLNFDIKKNESNELIIKVIPANGLGIHKDIYLKLTSIEKDPLTKKKYIMFDLGLVVEPDSITN